jgi:hypothetical protein
MFCARLYKEKFQDTKGVIRSRASKDRQYKEKDEKKSNDRQITMKKAKD